MSEIQQRKMPWHQAMALLRPFIFKISTPRGHGTGFQIFYRGDKNLCVIATAYHVIRHSYEWEEPIKLIHAASGKTIVLKSNRAIRDFKDKDLAFIIFLSTEDFPINKESLPKLIDPKNWLKQGVEIGWCGFPAVAPDDTLCFFAGHVSCYLKDDTYLIDGVAINGVSGGPAFYIDPEPKICGVITAYKPNLATGEVLPGVSIMVSVEPYQDALTALKSLGEAQQKSKEQKTEKKESQEAPPPLEKGEKKSVRPPQDIEESPV